MTVTISAMILAVLASITISFLEIYDPKDLEVLRAMSARVIGVSRR